MGCEKNYTKNYFCVFDSLNTVISIKCIMVNAAMVETNDLYRIEQLFYLITLVLIEAIDSFRGNCPFAKRNTQ